MDRIKLKETYNTLSDVQKQILTKAIKQISINNFNYIYNINKRAVQLDVINNDYIYTGYYNALTKRIRVNGKNIQHVHYAKNINTNEEIAFSLNNFRDIFPNASYDAAISLTNVMNTANRHLESILSRVYDYNNGITVFNIQQANEDIIKQVLRVKHSIRDLSNHEVIINLLYYDLPISDLLKHSLINFERKIVLKKEFDDFIELNPEYDTILTLLMLSPLDEKIRIKYDVLYDKYESIMKQYNDNKFLSFRQLEFLKKIAYMDFDELDKMFNFLTSLKVDSESRNNIMYLKTCHRAYGLNEKQIQQLTALYNKFKNDDNI